MIPVFRVKITDLTSHEVTYINDIFKTDAKVAIDRNRGQASFTFQSSADVTNLAGENTGNSYLGQNLTYVLKMDNHIEIYYKTDPSQSWSTDPLFSGRITSLGHQISSQGRWTTVRATDRMRMLMNDIVARVYEDETASYIVKDIIDQVNNRLDDTRKAYYEIGAEYVSTTGYIQDTVEEVGYDVGAGVYWIGRADYPAWKWIEEMASRGNTGTYDGTLASPTKPANRGQGQHDYGNFISYIDATNEFHFSVKSTTAASTITEGGFISMEATQDSDGVKNVLLVNCGDDLNSNPIFTVAKDTNSIREIGFKWGYEVDTKISEKAKREQPGLSNADLRTLSKERGLVIWENILRAGGRALWKSTVKLKGTNSYNIGNLITLNIPSLSWSVNDLRIEEISHTISKNGWITTLSLAQDAELVGAQA